MSDLKMLRERLEAGRGYGSPDASLDEIMMLIDCVEAADAFVNPPNSIMSVHACLFDDFVQARERLRLGITNPGQPTKGSL